MLRFIEKINGSKKAKQTNIHKKADQKLDFVAENMQNALGVHCTGVESDFFEKQLQLRNFMFLDQMRLSYKHENRLWAISYNLEWSSDIQAKSNVQEVGDCTFELSIQGLLHVKGMDWVCKGGSMEPEEEARYLDRLRNPLIMDRIRALDLNSVKVCHTEGTDQWHISCGSMIGSTTWILIPPVMQVISVRDKEYLQMVEFFELVADAVANNH